MGRPSPRQPDVLQQCFAGAEGRRPGDVRQSMASVAAGQQALGAQLHSLVMAFLKKVGGGA